MGKNPTFFAFAILLGFISSIAVTALDAPEAQAQTKRKKKRSHKAIGSVKAGLVGSGEATLSQNDTTTSLTDSNNFTLGGFALFPVGQNIRIGPSLAYYPSVNFTTETGSDGLASTNSEDDAYGFDINLMGEYSMPLQGLDGFGFLEVGYSSLVPAGTSLSDLTGFNIGGGAGAQFLVNKKMAVRGDLKITHYDLEGSSIGESSSSPIKLSGNRVMLNIGVVFAL